MILQHDTRDHAGKHRNVEQYLEENGHRIVRSKMYCGDITLMNDQSVCIDLKKDLQECCGNLCQQHDRFKAECIRAQDAGIKLIILVEHGRGVKSVDDVEKWQNPRLRTSPKATTGQQLAQTMRTMAERYGVEWMFCDKASTGKEIIRLLGGGT